MLAWPLLPCPCMMRRAVSPRAARTCAIHARRPCCPPRLLPSAFPPPPAGAPPRGRPTSMDAADATAAAAAAAGDAPPRPCVVIIGGQFAGLRARHLLEDAFDVTLIDNKACFEYTPGVPRCLVDTEHAATLLVPHAPAVVCASVVAVHTHTGAGAVPCHPACLSVRAPAAAHASWVASSHSIQVAAPLHGTHSIML